MAPEDLMQRVLNVLTQAGYQLESKKRNLGALKAFLNPPDMSVPADQEAAALTQALAGADLQVRLNDDMRVLKLKGEGFEVWLPKSGGTVGVKVFEAAVGEGRLISLTFGQLRGVIREVSFGPQATIKTANGRLYKGSKEDIIRALISYGSSHEEREAIVNGQIPINKGALASLQRRRAVRPVDVNRGKPLSQLLSKHRPDRYDRQAKARKKLDAAVKDYAEGWLDYKADYPDVQPSDIAYDAADGFFFSHPDWEKWARELGLSKWNVKEYVADSIAAVLER